MRKRDWSLVFLLVGVIFSWLYSGKADAGIQVRDNIYDILSIKDLTDAECMVYNNFHESRSESDIANYMVMASVINRVTSDRWGEEICQVVLQKHQYSWVRDGKSDYPSEKAQFYRMESLLTFFWINLEVIMEMSEGADMYHHKDIKPEWDWSQLEYVGQFDQHLFYKHK